MALNAVPLFVANVILLTCFKDKLAAMDRALLYQILQQSLYIVDEVQDNYEKVDIWTKVSEFMNGTMEIYLALKADPSVREDPEFQHYISKSG